MHYHIEISDLASNAFIEILKRNNNAPRFITYSKLEEYGNKVIEILNRSNIEGYLELSRNNTYSFLNEYSNFFEEDSDNDRIIKLKDNISYVDLIKTFRGYLALDLLLAFIHEDAINVLI